MRHQRFSRHNGKPKRFGSAAVEAALVLPLLIIVSFGAIDIAQYINLAQLVSNASREGARVASRNGTETVAQVEAAVVSFMSDALAHLSAQELADAIDIEVQCGPCSEAVPEGKMTAIESGESVTVHLSFDFAKVRWLSGPSYWNNDVQESTTVCRRE
jgi:hypothetical protein